MAAAPGTLEVRDMSGGVPLMTHLDRIRAKPLLALGSPAVTRVSGKSAEQPQRLLISPDRRRSPRIPAQRHAELLHIPRLPRPRVLTGELSEPPHQPHPLPDSALSQQPGPLLPRPP